MSKEPQTFKGCGTVLALPEGDVPADSVSPRLHGGGRDSRPRTCVDADAAQVTGRGALKQVGTVPNGVVLDDGEGHINAMFTINNAVADLRIGVSESQPGAGVTEIKQLANMIVANSKTS